MVLVLNFLKFSSDLMRPDGISVTFLPLDSLHRLPEKQKYTNFFNTIYFSARWEILFSLITTSNSYMFGFPLHRSVTWAADYWYECWPCFISAFLSPSLSLGLCCKAACTSWARRRDRLQHQTPWLSWSWRSEGFYSNRACYYGDSTVTKCSDSAV